MCQLFPDRKIQIVQSGMGPFGDYVTPTCIAAAIDTSVFDACTNYISIVTMEVA